MKKIYSQPELNLLVLTEDIVTASGGTTYTFTPEDFGDGNATDSWVW